MRTPSSCVACRQAKRKCSKQVGRTRCEGCERTGSLCSLFRTPRQQAVIIPAPSPAEISSLSRSSTDSVTGSLLPDLNARELVADYFYYIHDRPHTLFHQATFWEDMAHGRISTSLLYAVCSLASNLSRKPDVQRLGPHLALRAKQLLLADLENFCLQHVQTCVLLANVFAAELNPASEALYFGIANRMANLLRLHAPHASDDAIMRETKIRVWWTLVMADQWCSSGLGIPRQLQGYPADVALPMDEKGFQAMVPGDVAIPTVPPEAGLWGYMITLVEIFVHVHDLNRQVVSMAGFTEETSDTNVAEIAQRLQDWIDALPDRLLLTDTNLDYHRTRGFGGAFVALHLGYHHYATLLYFRYLDIRKWADPTAEEYASRCQRHASSYSRLLAQSRERDGCAAVYATVGHMTVVSSCVLLHALLFGSEGQLEATRRDLTLNFTALVELRRLWPSLKRTIDRLSTFQAACLHPSSLNPHRMDRWMIRFLLEHSVDLEERAIGEESTEPFVPSTTGLSSARALMADDAVAYLWENG